MSGALPRSEYGREPAFFSILLEGPQLPEKEKPSSASSRARDFLFELVMAAKLIQAGFQTTLGETPDLSCDVGGTALLFECKRPSSHKMVKARLKEARDSLRVCLKHSRPGNYGVVALSFTKIYNPGDKHLLGPDEAALRRGLARELAMLADSAQSAWAKWKGKDVVGLLFHIGTPAENRSESRIFFGQQLLAYQIADPGKAGGKAFWRLSQGLNALAH